MLYCDKCGAEVRYVAVGATMSVECDYAARRVVTANGRMLNGYTVHNCSLSNVSGDDDAEKKDK